MQAKLQWLQNPSQTNVDHLNIIRYKTGSTFRNKKRGGGGHLKDKRNEFETNSKKKYHSLSLFKSINIFKKGYQPRNNLVKDKNDDLLADTYNILNRQNCLSPYECRLTWR